MHNSSLHRICRQLIWILSGQYRRHQLSQHLPFWIVSEDALFALCRLNLISIPLFFPFKIRIETLHFVQDVKKSSCPDHTINCLPLLSFEPGGVGQKTVARDLTLISSNSFWFKQTF